MVHWNCLINCLIIGKRYKMYQFIQINDCLKPFKTKLLLSKKQKTNKNNYSVPIMNFPWHHLFSVETKQLQITLNYYYAHHYKHIKKNLGAKLESVAHRISDDVDRTHWKSLINFEKYASIYFWKCFEDKGHYLP